MNVISVIASVIAGVAVVTPARRSPCHSRSRWTWCVVLLVLSVVLATPTTSRADIGVIVLEPIGALGFFTRVGHAGTYFSNICQDGSPIRMRLCLPGESGGVVSKYSPLSEHEDYDWAIVPFEEYMHGFGSPDFAPMIGTPKLQSAIERYNFGPLFSRALKTTSPEELPDGQWKAALATRFDRTIYILSVETSAADDAIIVAAFNAAPNKSRFNFFYRNCSNQAKAIFDLILPHIDTIGDRTSGVTMETPKGLAKALVDQALRNPALNLRVRRYAQIPGTFGRSRDVLFPMENTYRSLGFAPWWFFGGFREVALGAMFYHEVLSPFDMLESSRDFISPKAAQLTLEQDRLRRRQDEVRLALASAHNRSSSWWKLSELNTEVFRRLGEVRNEKRAEVRRVAGSQAQWHALDMEFRTMVRALSERRFVPEALREPFAQFEPNGTLSDPLLQYFEARGAFYVDAARGPWMTLPLVEGETQSTGLSRSQILAGDPRVALLLLAAVIDYNLYESEGHREDIEYVHGMFALFRQANDTISRQAGGR
ncbi:MAG: hypothetical protein ABW318_16550 [Vicinamibacterales bacterium]